MLESILWFRCVTPGTQHVSGNEVTTDVPGMGQTQIHPGAPSITLGWL